MSHGPLRPFRYMVFLPNGKNSKIVSFNSKKVKFIQVQGHEDSSRKLGTYICAFHELIHMYLYGKFRVQILIQHVGEF